MYQNVPFQILPYVVTLYMFWPRKHAPDKDMDTENDISGKKKKRGYDHGKDIKIYI